MKLYPKGKVTKKNAIYIDWYNERRSQGFLSLYAAYKQPSDYKIAAWKSIQCRADVISGTLTILGHSCHHFSTGYLSKQGDDYNLIIDTACNTFTIPVTVVDR